MNTKLSNEPTYSLKMKRLKFVYRNHRGEISERIVRPDGRPQYRMEWYPAGMNEYHPDGGWMFSGDDEARRARRTFALKNIIGPITEVD